MNTDKDQTVDLKLLKDQTVDLRQSNTLRDTIKFRLDFMQMMLAAGRREFAERSLAEVYEDLQQVPSDIIYTGNIVKTKD
jgi:hypothetical protein|tara:strand:+ start:876 stop:1115 length:240 start_codon:yes stop_codon:yes gene_type:complete